MLSMGHLITSSALAPVASHAGVVPGGGEEAERHRLPSGLRHACVHDMQETMGQLALSWTSIILEAPARGMGHKSEKKNQEACNNILSKYSQKSSHHF